MNAVVLYAHFVLAISLGPCERPGGWPIACRSERHQPERYVRISVQSMRRVLLLDCDGVLAETELYGHLPAFNQTFVDLGVPLSWSREEYGRLLAVTGGKERMLHALTPELIEEAGLPSDPDALAAEAARWHAHKTAVFSAMIAGRVVEPRSGIRRLVSEAIAAGWEVAMVSTSALASVEGVMLLAFGPELAQRLAIFTGDSVPRKKPAPDIYLDALERLDAPLDSTVAIEDSRNGLLAATGAGIVCVITRSAFTPDENMEEATIVMSELGDPGLPAPVVEANHTAAVIDGYLTLGALEACFGSRRPAA